MGRNKKKPGVTIGILLVFLVAVIGQGVSAGNTVSVSGVVVPVPPPIAGYSATPVTGTAPLTVKFMDQSSGAITAWAWDFNNDGTTDSAVQNPILIYSLAGTYTVSLTVTGPGGSDSEVKTGYITVKAPERPPVARFTQDKYIGRAPLTVRFTDRSRNNPTSYFWQFGDGSSSQQKDAVHTFIRPGIYFIRERVTNAAGSDTSLSAVAVSGGWWW